MPVKLTEKELLESGGSGTNLVAEHEGRIVRVPVSGLTDPGLEQPDKLAGAADVGKKLEELRQEIADLKYVPIKITAFGCAPNVAEMGSMVTAVTLSWGINKVPASLTLNGEPMDAGETNVRLEGLELTGNKTWTLKAVDERDTEVTATATLTFLNGVYYGSAAEPDSIDSGLILGLTKTLRSAKLPRFTVDAGDGEYIWYCVPSRFGACVFKFNNMEGGIDLADTIDFENGAGYTESYSVYRSAHAGLGSMTWEVS